MDNPNPFASPRLEYAQSVESTEFKGPIISRCIFSSEMVIETMARYRSQHTLHRVWRIIRVACGVIFILIAVGSLIIARFAGAAVVVILAIVMFTAHKLDDYFLVRRLKKTAEYNSEYMSVLSNEEIRQESITGMSTLNWSAFTSAVIFRDGVLLFQGLGLAHWIPDKSLENNEDAQRLRMLVAAKLPTKVML